MTARKTAPTRSDQLGLSGTVEELKTAICVPAIRSAVADWRGKGYPDTTEITRELLFYWFESDHKRSDGTPLKFYDCQREAVESLVYVWEVAKVRNQKALLQQFRHPASSPLFPRYDEFPRYCIKMATGSGKTVVMALTAVWQYLNAVSAIPGVSEQYAKTFLVIAPNVIVFDRLKTDFDGGNIFKDYAMIPSHQKVFWEFDCIMRGAGERPHSEGVLLLTNIHQLYDKREKRGGVEPPEMTGVLGPKPHEEEGGIDFREFLARRGEPVLVLNDEAHHTHEDESEWNRVIRHLDSQKGVRMQLDFSATPRYQSGQLFPWTISDYTLKQAIVDGIVKRPMKGITHAEERPSKNAFEKYKFFLTAGVERWREYRDELGSERLGSNSRRPVLFIMMNSTDEADEVADGLKKSYPDDFAGEKTQVIHTDMRGENAGQVSKDDLVKARRAVRQIDLPDSSINAIVSVLMLREGWDVKGVTVVVGLRPYTSKANILPEQTIGRGLRLMFRGQGFNYTERVDVIGNRAFLDFVEELEKMEEIEFGTFDIEKDHLHIVVIQPDVTKIQYDIGIPILTPLITRRKNIAEEIALLDVMTLPQPNPLELSKDAKIGKEFHFEGFDVITKQKLLERDYRIDAVTIPQEILGFYTELVASELRLPSHFAVLYPKVRDYFENKAFGKLVDLFDPLVMNAMSSTIAGALCVKLFKQALGPRLVNQEEPQLVVPSRLLSELTPFPWSQPTYKASKCVLNLVPCDNDLEKDFAAFLDRARDVRSFSKLPLNFGFSIEYLDGNGNMRHYYPDFVVSDVKGNQWLIETKGLEDVNVVQKDEAAVFWCENASRLTGFTWKYLRVNQRDYEELQPKMLADLEHIQ